MKRKGKKRSIIANIWKDKKTTILGVLGASGLLVGQYLITGDPINWRAVLGAAVIAAAGAFSNSNSNINHGKEKPDAEQDYTPADPHHDDDDFIVQPEDRRYYENL